MDGTEEPATKRCKGSEQNEQKLVDGITDFKKGQRDFTPQSDTAAAISADFTSKEKEYTNGVVAPTLDTFWHCFLSCFASHPLFPGSALLNWLMCDRMSANYKILQTEKSYFERQVLLQEIIFLSCCFYFVLLLSFLRGKFCCRAVARNRWRSHQGQLTNELVRIPDVDSGYPKSVYPTAWEDTFLNQFQTSRCFSVENCRGEDSCIFMASRVSWRAIHEWCVGCQDGQALPKSVESFALGNGFPDQNEFRMKFGVPWSCNQLSYRISCINWNSIESKVIKTKQCHPHVIQLLCKRLLRSLKA